MNSSDPKIIRQLMRQRRRAIDGAQQYQAAQRLSRHIVNTSIYQQSQHIAVYWAVGGEIGLDDLVSKAWAEGKSCYLPILHGQQLRFVAYTADTILENNRFGIPEPRLAGDLTGSQVWLRSPEELDLVLLPLVAFDQHNHRIGMGGGFYDRTFGDECPRVPYLMGVAHCCQQIENIKAMPWDVLLNDVITD